MRLLSSHWLKDLQFSTVCWPSTLATMSDDLKIMYIFLKNSGYHCHMADR